MGGMENRSEFFFVIFFFSFLDSFIVEIKRYLFPLKIPNR